MDYFSSENKNGILLESILRDELINTGLSIQYIKKAINGERIPMEDIRIMIQWCRSSVIKYVEQKGALCKGELTTMGGIILNANPYQFSQKIIVRPVVNGKSLRDLLQEKGIGYETFSSLISSLDTRRIIIYPKVTDKKNLIWYGVREEALRYVENYLTILDKTTPTPKIIPPERKKIYAMTKNVEKIKEEPLIITPQIFLNKYNLENKLYMHHSPVAQPNLDKTLFDAGMKDMNDIIAIKRRIKRSPVLNDALMIPGSNDYSKEKLKELSNTYLIRDSVGRRELLKEIDTVFNIVIL
jgi:hypothetical protein